MIEDFCCILISLVSFCSHLSCVLFSSSGAEIVLFRQVPTVGLILNLSRAIHARQREDRVSSGPCVDMAEVFRSDQVNFDSTCAACEFERSILEETLTVCRCQRFTKTEWRSQQCAGHLKWRLAPLATKRCVDSFKD